MNSSEKFSYLRIILEISLLNLLYAISAGMAAIKPKAVAIRASEIPGATNAIVV